MPGGNYLSYLNHIIIAHYNASYGCGKCLKQAFMSSSALYNHKKMCLGFTKEPATALTASPAAVEEVMAATVTPPKKKNSKTPTANSQGSGTQTALQTMPRHNRQEKSHHHKSHKDSKDSSGNKKKDVSPARKSSSHKVHNDGGPH